MPRKRMAAALILAQASGTIGAVQAATAPEYRRLNEFHTVLRAYQDGGVMRIGPIDGIERLDADTYRLRGGGCTIDGTLRWPPPDPGPPMAGGDPTPGVDFGAPSCAR